ncbi:hypothetical protein KW428_21815 [Vibrio fluvialis]|uniref:hypothetical protein n=1 Tax=Vibrio fluvialis TaxID=676 RepID=UPI001C9CF975|nr:hypothetical protein [Vibrio fluvialis]ELS3717393.1 hypothetical protein [Vibrio fluvialis]ELX9694090.1 hypothetical protein [Vibrio fluvialis]MBY7865297.1 hypothetical protein [Vibrio fluvialis]MBY8092579.1 hypothetical protein [Vibrio fluvialis]WMN57874.1 hypothetical protein NI390_16420 [Vibrio fluvialis]
MDNQNSLFNSLIAWLVLAAILIPLSWAYDEIVLFYVFLYRTLENWSVTLNLAVLLATLGPWYLVWNYIRKPKDEYHHTPIYVYVLIVTLLFITLVTITFHYQIYYGIGSFGGPNVREKWGSLWAVRDAFIPNFFTLIIGLLSLKIAKKKVQKVKG